MRRDLIAARRHELERVWTYGDNDFDSHAGILGCQIGRNALLVARIWKARVIQVLAVDLEAGRPLGIELGMKPVGDLDRRSLGTLILKDDQHTVHFTRVGGHRGKRPGKPFAEDKQQE
jgi:hypothetical protein